MPAPVIRASDLDPLRPALLGHCYRMLGSPTDADDAVQETMIKAMRALPSFEGRSSLKTWVMRIATRVCLDELSRRQRRIRPMESPAGTPAGPFEITPAEGWIEPVPDGWIVDDADPEAVLASRQSLRLAFVAALQHLPPRQRAALLLTQVVGLSARETAEALESSVSSVNSALQRARSRMAELSPERPPIRDPAVAEVADRYLAAFQRYDVDAIVRMLSEDVTFDMPPISLWVRGPDHVRTFLRGPGAECEGSVLVPVQASGAAAFAQYRHGGRTPWGLVVLDIRNGQISGITTFLDVERLFPLFGLPLEWKSRG